MSATKQITSDRMTDRLKRLKQTRTKLEQELEKIANDSSIYEFSKALKEIKQVDDDIKMTELAIERRAGR